MPERAERSAASCCLYWLRIRRAGGWDHGKPWWGDGLTCCTNDCENRRIPKYTVVVNTHSYLQIPISKDGASHESNIPMQYLSPIRTPKKLCFNCSLELMLPSCTTYTGGDHRTVVPGPSKDKTAADRTIISLLSLRSVSRAYPNHCRCLFGNHARHVISPFVLLSLPVVNVVLRNHTERPNTHTKVREQPLQQSSP